MKTQVWFALWAGLAFGEVQAQDVRHGYPYSPVPFTSVKVTDGFWGQRLKASREVTIPLAFSKCEETGRYENFVKAAHPSEEYKVGGLPFDDTDVLTPTRSWRRISTACWSLWPPRRSRTVTSTPPAR